MAITGDAIGEFWSIPGQRFGFVQKELRVRWGRPEQVTDAWMPVAHGWREPVRAAEGVRALVRLLGNPSCWL